MTWYMGEADIQYPICDICCAEGPGAPLGEGVACMDEAIRVCTEAGWTFPIVRRAQVDTCRACSAGIPMGQLELSFERKCA